MTLPKQIRVLRLIARLNIGGPAIQVISLSEKLSDKYFRTLLVCGRIGDDEGDMAYFAEGKNLEIQTIPQLGREISFLDDLKSFCSILKIIRRFKPDIIHTHTAKAGTIGRLAGITANLFRRYKNRIRLVHTFHGHVFRSYFSRIKTFVFIFIERFLARFSDKIIVISPGQKDDICRVFKIASPSKVKVIPLGFDLSPFSNLKKNSVETRRKFLSENDSDIILVGIIGRLTAVKNHHMLLKSIKHLKEKGEIDTFRFLIVGDGELRKILEETAYNLGIEGHVSFTGWQRDMPSIYSVLDAVVLTSYNEGTPVTLIEAMAAGKFIISTDVGGVKDLLGDRVNKSEKGFEIFNNGIALPSDESKTMAEALVYYKENRELLKTSVSRSKDFAIETFSVERLVKDIKKLYTELLDESSVYH